MIDCRVCGGAVETVLDLGRQPMANGFLRPEQIPDEHFFQLAVGMCARCTTVQLMEEVKQELRYHEAYRYQASGSISHRSHFTENARRFMATELTGPDAFIVEIGCNDGVMLSTIAQAGVRHLGVEPSSNVAAVAESKGVRVRRTFFDEGAGRDVRAADGPAKVIFGANTICHIAHIESLFRGVDALLADDGVFVFEEPYVGTLIDRTAFDQIYDEHVFYFTVRSVANIAEQFGFELVDAERIPMHGGEIRYTIARPGRRTPAPAVRTLLAEERRRGFAERATFEQFGATVAGVRDDLVTLLRRLRDDGKRVVGYGAPGKATTATNYFGIGPELVPFVCDSTPEKQGHLVPGTHIPVLPPSAFSQNYPDYALLFAWNHADEIMAKEQAFADAGGQWIVYIPQVRIATGPEELRPRGT